LILGGVNPKIRKSKNIEKFQKHKNNRKTKMSFLESKRENDSTSVVYPNLFKP